MYIAAVFNYRMMSTRRDAFVFFCTQECAKRTLDLLIAHKGRGKHVIIKVQRVRTHLTV